SELDWHDSMQELYKRGVRVINCLGGSEINAQLFRENLVDEIFITIAPKVKLGEDVPTIADGVPLPREEVQNFELLSCQQVGNEVFLRYRRIKVRN
ncbi:MAG TPA: dihydrofolate reductase family protein, partial [Fimbriimonas sp.]|nr:dihydrofolate reductase family protein [Fimbriimonas sp.]